MHNGDTNSFFSLCQAASKIIWMFQATENKKNKKKGIEMPATIFYHTQQLKLKLHIIYVYIKWVSALNPQQFNPPHSVKDKWVRRRLEEMQCLIPGLWSRGTAELGTQLEIPPLPAPRHPAPPGAGSSGREPDSTHLHQHHLWIMQPFQNKLIKTLLLSLHFCLWIRKSLF